MTFRSAWLRTVPLGLLDLGLHAFAAFWLLPGPWWFQYLPDVLVPVLWLRSMSTDRMADDDDVVLELHRLLHMKRQLFNLAALLWWLASLLLAWLLDVNIFVLPLHLAVHLLIDATTHGKEWQ